MFRVVLVSMGRANIYSDANADRGTIRYHNKIVTVSETNPKSGYIMSDGKKRVKKVGNRWILIDHY